MRRWSLARRPAATLLLGAFLLTLMVNVVFMFVIVIPQLHYQHQLIQRSIDLAAVAGATQADAALLATNVPALDKTAAEAKTRLIAQRNLEGAETHMTQDASTIANRACSGSNDDGCMTVWVRNTGELDPWTSVAITQPTVFVELRTREKGLFTYAIVGSSPGSLESNPLAGAMFKMRAKASLRLRS